jgi:hypothetical protein
MAHFPVWRATRVSGKLRLPTTSSTLHASISISNYKLKKLIKDNHKSELACKLTDSGSCSQRSQNFQIQNPNTYNPQVETIPNTATLLTITMNLLTITMNTGNTCLRIDSF